MKKITLLFCIAPLLIGAEDNYTKRLAQSTLVLREMGKTSDAGVPQDLLAKAQCVVVVPGLKKVAFIGGGKYGRGFASCITSKGWSAPAGVRIEGGSFGLQLGGSSTDVILLVMNQGGMTKLTSDKFTIGGQAEAAAGPVGRSLSAKTDVLMKAQILTYSRSRGAFAGLSLEGATLRPDTDVNTSLYGKEVTNLQLLTGTESRPAAAAPFLRELQRFSGKGKPPVMTSKSGRKGRKSLAADGSAAMDSSAMASTAPDNTRVNKKDRAPSEPTADQQKNNSSDLDITKNIRRSVIADGSLSTYGHNVKIIARNGMVTLKGPVRSDDEKSSIAAKAAAVVGADKVDNQLTVAPPK